MKYAILIVSLLILLMILIVLYFKKTTAKNSASLPYQTKKKKEIIFSNPNPVFEVELIDYKKNQLSISKSTINESIYFKVAKNKRINVYTINKKYLGQIAIKDYKAFSLISMKPNYFEGQIKDYILENIAQKKVIINIQAKIEYSQEIYSIDKAYLNNLITLEAIFSINQIIKTNYGPSTIIEIFKDYLVVEVPSLGKREIYDIDSILNEK